MVTMGEQSFSPPLSRHVPALDGIRGVAILLVLGFHLLTSNFVTGSRVFDFLVKVRMSGWVGVDLFFALSGFLITGVLLDAREGPGFLRHFYMRRLLRIAPLYYLVLILLLVGFRPSTWAEGRPFLLLLTHLQNTPLWWSHPVPGPVAADTLHLWSLAAEEQFYLVWPLVVLLVPSRRRLLWVALAGIALAPVSRYLLLAHGASFEATYKLTLCRADSLLAGASLALVYRSAFRSTLLRAAPFALAVSVLACLMLAWRTGNFDYTVNRPLNLIGYTLIALASASLIALALSPATRTARALATPTLRFFGRFSFGLYVLHQMVASLVDLRFGGSLHHLIPQKSVLHLVSMALVLLFTIPLAMLSFYCVERPFLRLKHIFGPNPDGRYTPPPTFPTRELSPALRTQP